MARCFPPCASKITVGAIKARAPSFRCDAPQIPGISQEMLNWDGLTRFLDDGRIELDINLVERSMHCY
jgi:hypothetical protein